MAVEAEPKGASEKVEGHVPATEGRKRWSRGRIAVLALAVVALGAVLVFPRGADDPQQDRLGAEEEADADINPFSGLPEGYVTHRDDETGFSLAHPETWVQLVRPQGEMRLVLGVGDGTTVRVRVAELEGAIDAGNIDEITAVTSGIVAAPNPAVEKQFLKRDFVSVNGLPGYYYLYRLKDTETGEQAVNAFYFVFQGRKMNILMFQSLSPEDFELHAADFDRILNSFRSDPSVPAG